MSTAAVLPQITDEVLASLAQAEGVCIRPLLNKVTDTATGQTHVVPIRCGSTREAVCPPCAQRNRRLRMQQCREGWHLDTEPERDAVDRVGSAYDDVDVDDGVELAKVSRRVRSTRRRQDAPDLPRLPVESRTIGKVFEAPGGRRFRPSMFATFTLPSYGRVRQDGTPVDPEAYDYRLAALDALHFPKLVDRLWQNLRRATGYRVQYFAAVEPQRRLAPHLHAAIRGAIPRQVFRQVVAATYHQVWWPSFDEAVFTEDRLPVWSNEVDGYVDPATGAALPTWEEALDRLDDDLDADPTLRSTHVVRFGAQLDLQGIIATSNDADRRVGYLTKYLNKSVADTYGDPDDITPAQAAHQARLFEEVRWLPCSPRCWNWLRYGVQPDQATEGMVPGRCPGKAHRWENLGCGGRRVLVSRKWTGKTLADHQADRATVVREGPRCGRDRDARRGPVFGNCRRRGRCSSVRVGADRPRPGGPGHLPAGDLAFHRAETPLANEYEAAKAMLDSLSATGPPGDGGEAA